MNVPSPCNCNECNETPEEFAEGYLKYLYKQYKQNTDSPLSYDEWEEELSNEEGKWL